MVGMHADYAQLCTVRVSLLAVISSCKISLASQTFDKMYYINLGTTKTRRSTSRLRVYLVSSPVVRRKKYAETSAQDMAFPCF